MLFGQWHVVRQARRSGPAFQSEKVELRRLPFLLWTRKGSSAVSASFLSGGSGSSRCAGYEARCVRQLGKEERIVGGAAAAVDGIEDVPADALVVGMGF